MDVTTDRNLPKAYAKVTLEEEGDASAAVAIYLPIDPHGLTPFVTDDDTEDSHALADEVAVAWPELWPRMRERLTADMQSYGNDPAQSLDDFIGLLGRMTPDVWMGDRSDILIRLEFPEPPLWDFFITKEGDIVHSQPVF